MWRMSHRFDPAAAELADRHYSRRTPGSPQFVAPGRCLVLRAPGAVWVTLAQRYARHAWRDAWVCSMFRNEGPLLSSDLIREAVAATRWRFGDPPGDGLVTFVDAAAVRPKRDPGRCFLRAGFEVVGETAGGHGRRSLVVLAMRPRAMPGPAAPLGATLDLLRAGDAAGAGRG